MTSNEREWLAHQFDESRPYLRAVAYRMLGSMSEAEDAVQDAWLRLDHADSSGIEDLRRWLTVVVSRICLDQLRARQSRLEDYVGTWLPEPVVQSEATADALQEAVLADSVGIALLVVLDTLTPTERLAFVLHDVFAVSFEEIAVAIGKSPAAARQLASRARRRVREGAPAPDTDRATQQGVVDAFLAAARTGDFEALLAVLAPDVVLRTDGGGAGPLARPPVIGARAVARHMKDNGPRFAPLGRPITVNGGPGVFLGAPGQPRVVVGFTIAHGRVAAIDIIGDPAKLAHLGLT
jgi:RNA polymerase sigma factor (sigma-70 family)